MKSRIVIVCMFTFVLMLSNCGPKMVVQPEPKRTAAQEYSFGVEALANGDWENAALAFNQAIVLDANYGRAYSGLGLVLATRGEFEKALQYADKGLSRERIEETLVIKAEIVSIIKPEGWIDNVLALYDEAISKNPRKNELVFQKADILLSAGEYKTAFDLYDELAKGSGAFADSAKKQAATAFSYYRAAPQSETAQKILCKDEISRGDLAALLVDELGLMEIVNKKRPKSYSGGYTQQGYQLVDPDKIPDISGHWAEKQIKLAAQTGAMDVFPDFSFRPNDIVTRKDLAMVLQNVLIIATGSQRLATQYAGKSSPFYDVNRNHYAFNAISLVVDRNLMRYNTRTNEFELNSPVTGLEAQSAVKVFIEQL